MAGYGGVPEGPLSAYMGVRQANEQAGLQGVQGATQMQGLLAKMQAEQRAKQFQAEIEAAKTPEDKIAVASKYASPAEVLHWISASKDRAATADATKAQRDVVNELARGRLGETRRVNDYNVGTPGTPIAPPPSTNLAAPSPAAPGLSSQMGGMQIPPAVQAGRNQESTNIQSGLTPSGTGPAIPSAAVLSKPATMPEMPPEIAASPPRIKNQWRLQQTKPSIAGSGSFTPQALNFTAKQYLTGDRQAVLGFARNATARIALQNEIVDEAARQGKKPEEVAALMAEFAGTMAGSRTVGQRAANISLAATEAQEMIGIVKESSDKFARTNFVPWNMALKAYESGTGTPEIAAFGASVNALVNVYARAINPTGVPTVSDKEHARAVLNTVQSPAQVDAVLGIIRKELEIAKKAPAQVRQGIRESIVPKKDSWDADKERRYQEWKAKQ